MSSEDPPRLIDLDDGAVVYHGEHDELACIADQTTTKFHSGAVTGYVTFDAIGSDATWTQDASTVDNQLAAGVIRYFPQDLLVEAAVGDQAVVVDRAFLEDLYEWVQSDPALDTADADLRATIAALADLVDADHNWPAPGTS
jgi:hypothetical protein